METKMTTAPDHFAAYMAGDAITKGLANLYARDGVTVNAYVLTDAEFVAIAAHANTLPSTPANNVWD
jgi:hypothetical protein